VPARPEFAVPDASQGTRHESGVPSLALCNKNYTHIDSLADWWVGRTEGGRPRAGVPTRAAFVAVCTKLPEGVQLCLNMSYEAAHEDSCNDLVGTLTRRQVAAIDELFFAEPP
jgi:hypothetical protein